MSGCLGTIVLSWFMPLFYFFFSSRRLHTISFGDWSSDVCSSDLQQRAACIAEMRARQGDQPVRSMLKPFAAQFGAAAMLILQIGARQQPAQQQIARAGLAQQQQTIGAFAIGVVGDVHIATGDRFDAGTARRFVEFDQAKEVVRSEEHTSELQSPKDLVCRLLLE